MFDPHTKVVTYEEWLRMPEVEGAKELEVLYLEDGKLRRRAILAEGILTPKHFPNVQIRIAGIWPD